MFLCYNRHASARLSITHKSSHRDLRQTHFSMNHLHNSKLITKFA